jgi:hypothetical protein
MSRTARRFCACLIYGLAALLAGAAVAERKVEIDPRGGVACGLALERAPQLRP